MHNAFSGERGEERGESFLNAQFIMHNAQLIVLRQKQLITNN
jgi:hypothetical protein